MPQTNYTPILIYASGTTGNTPAAGNLTNSAGGAELAINYFDGRLFYKDASNVVQVLATRGTATIGGSNTQVQYNNNGELAGSANMTFNGTSLTLAANPTLSGGTANGVLYLDGSKVATSGSALTFDGTNLGIGTSSPGAKLDVVGALNLQGSSTFPTTGMFLRSADNQLKIIGGSAGIAFAAASGASTYATINSSGNLGLGVTPSAWTTYNVLQVGKAALTHNNNNTYLGANWFYDGANKYIATDHALLYAMENGVHAWFTAPSGTAGNAISFTQAMAIPAAGGLVVGAAALATTATDGFLYVPTCAGTPTGTPTTQTGTAPIVVDTTNNKLYFYSGGSWVAAN